MDTIPENIKIKESKINETNTQLELGYIIKIYATNNDELNEKIFFIDYLDNYIIKLISYIDFKKITLNITGNKLNDDTIEVISILDKPEHKGYAKQNNLLVDKLISIEFGGNEPMIINGKITNLEEDRIELNVFENSKFNGHIYIDFGYKGIPLDIPIKSIKQFILPIKQYDIDDDIDDTIIDKGDIPNIYDTDVDKDNINNEIYVADTSYINTDGDIHKSKLLSLKDINIISVMDKVSVELDVNEDEERYAIDTQTESLLDDILSNIPTEKRNRYILNKIHTSIERFKELRHIYSNYDARGNANSYKLKGYGHKPLLNSCLNINNINNWFIPIVKVIPKTYEIFSEEHAIYNEHVDGIVNFSNTGNQSYFTDEYILKKSYKNNNIDGDNKYMTYSKMLNNLYTPFINSSNNKDILYITSVNTNVETYINNDGDLYSKNNSVRFKNLKYIVGQNIYKYNENNTYSKIQITPNDNIMVSGFLKLPLPFIKYNKLYTPNTNILNRIGLNNIILNKWQYLNNTSIIHKIILNDNNNPLEYTNISNKMDNMGNMDINKQIENIRVIEPTKLGKNFVMKNISYIYINNEKGYYDNSDDNYQTYKNFLNNIIPSTKNIIEIFKNDITYNLSYHNIINYLEVFNIYKDDITYKQYETINKYVYNNIRLYEKKLKNNLIGNDRWLNTINYVEEYSILDDIFNKKYVNNKTLEIDLYNILKNTYNLYEHTSDTEELNNMNNIDNGRLYNNAITYINLELYNEFNLNDIITEKLNKLNDNMGDDVTNINKCNNELVEQKNNILDDNKLILAKRYNDIEDLYNDEGKEVYFDKKYGDISNKVEEGHYSILDLGDYDYKYFERKGKKWILDSTKNFKNINDINFCNLQDNCIKIKKNCNDMVISMNILKKQLLEQMSEEFEVNIYKNYDNLVETIKQNHIEYIEKINKIRLYNNEQGLKYNKIYLKLSNSYDTQDIITSPYIKYRDLILGNTAIDIQYNDILLFINKYCREYNNNNDDESVHWYYCKETNTKLLPTFFYDLAVAFNTGNYRETLLFIEKTRGKKSNDGGMIIDKYSGFYINNMLFDTDEGYDSYGYKVTSRSINNCNIDDMDMNIFNNILSDIKQPIDKNNAMENELIINVIKTLDHNLGINMENEYNFIIKYSMILKNSALTNYTEWDHKLKMADKKNKKHIQTYNEYQVKILFISIISSYILSIQLTIPNITTNKEFGNICKKSFTGYPLYSNNDLSYMQYITCVVLKLRSSLTMWNTLPKTNKKNFYTKQEKYITQLQTYINILINIPEIIDRIQQKHIWNKNNQNINEYIAYELNINSWVSFLPTLYKFNIPSVTYIGNSFLSALNTTINNSIYIDYNINGKSMSNKLNDLYGKIITTSMAIQNNIQDVIDKHANLLLENNMGELYKENTCCIEDNNTFNYFLRKNKNISLNRKNVKHMSDIYYSYTKLSIPNQRFIDINTKYNILNINDIINIESIYKTFIKYCHINTGLIMSDEFKGVCHTNVSEFTHDMTIQNKIDILKSEGHNYLQTNLNELLKIIINNNIIDIDISIKKYDDLVIFKLYIKYLLNNNKYGDDINNLLINIQNLIDRPSILNTIDYSIDFIKKIQHVNHLLKNNFINELRKIHKNNKEISNIDNLLTYIINDSDNDYWGNIYGTGHMYINEETNYNIFNIIKEFIIKIIHIFPNIIINGHQKYNTVDIPSTWAKEFSSGHIAYIQQYINDNGYFNNYYDNDHLNTLLNIIINSNKDIIELIKLLPFFTNMDNKISVLNANNIKNIITYILLKIINQYLNDIGKIDLNLNIEHGKDTTIRDTGIYYLRHEHEFKVNVCSLLVKYFNILKDDIGVINKSNISINNYINIIKKKERDKKRQKYKRLSNEQRNVQKMHQDLKLGEWAIGLSKKIYKYDKGAYDIEKAEILEDIRNNNHQYVEENLLTTEVMDEYTELSTIQDINNERYNMNNVFDDDDTGTLDSDLYY